MTLLDRHRRLKSIGNALLKNEALSDEDRNFIGEALVNIGDGSDAQVMLEIKPRRGESCYQSQRNRNVRNQLVLAWVAAAKAPESEGGLGLTLEQTIAKIANETTIEDWVGIEADTIRKYWNNSPSQRSRDFHSQDL